MQIARNITDVDDGFLRGKRYLILDRDAKYSDGFRSLLVREGIHVVRLPPRSPNLNANASYCLLSPGLLFFPRLSRFRDLWTLFMTMQ